MSLETRLGDVRVTMGATTRLTATVRALGAEDLAMTLARVGIPAGLSVQAWQLDDLVKTGVIDFYETAPRDVYLYFRGLPKGVERTIHLDLVAEVPGTYEGPASAAFLYYADEDQSWAPPLKVEIVP